MFLHPEKNFPQRQFFLVLYPATGLSRRFWPNHNVTDRNRAATMNDRSVARYEKKHDRSMAMTTARVIAPKAKRCRQVE